MIVLTFGIDSEPSFFWVSVCLPAWWLLFCQGYAVHISKVEPRLGPSVYFRVLPVVWMLRCGRQTFLITRKRNFSNFNGENAFDFWRQTETTGATGELNRRLTSCRWQPGFVMAQYFEGMESRNLEEKRVLNYFQLFIHVQIRKLATHDLLIHYCWGSE